MFVIYNQNNNFYDSSHLYFFHMPYIFFRALKLLIYPLLLPIINLYKQFGVAPEMIQPQSYKINIKI